MEESSKILTEEEIKSLLSLIGDIETNEKDAPIILLKKFSVSQWGDWIDDIINYGFANPLSQISREGDVILDMVDYLRKNSISIYPYEEAISAIVNQFDFRYSNPRGLERLLEALISIRERKSSSILIKMVCSRDNNYIKGNQYYIKSLALLGLVKSAQLDEKQVKEVRGYIKMAGFNDMIHDPVFFGNALRFFHTKISVHSFFSNLESAIRILNNNSAVIKNDNYLCDRHVTVLVDKLEELHYVDIGKFYSAFCRWFLNVISLAKDFSSGENIVYKMVLERFAELLDKTPYREEVIVKRKSDLSKLNDDLFLENGYALSVNVFLSISMERKKVDITYVEILYSLAFLLEIDRNEHEIQLKKVLNRYGRFLRRYYNSIPYLVNEELGDLFDLNVRESIIEMCDEAIYSDDVLDPDLMEDLRLKRNRFFHFIP